MFVRQTSVNHFNTLFSVANDNAYTFMSRRGIVEEVSPEIILFEARPTKYFKYTLTGGTKRNIKESEKYEVVYILSQTALHKVFLFNVAE